MSLPFYPMYPTDFEADTSHLTLAEDGAYNRLLRLMWMSPGCSFPDDDRWIMRRMRVDQATFDDVVLPIISEFFTRKKGRVFSPRLLEEFEASNAKHKKRVSAGRKGGRRRNALKNNETDPSNAKAKLKQPEPYKDIKENNKKKKPIPDEIPTAESVKRAGQIFVEFGKPAHFAQHQVEPFRDDALTNGRKYADWHRAFLKWCRTAASEWGKLQPIEKAAADPDRRELSQQEERTAAGQRYLVDRYKRTGVWEARTFDPPDTPGTRLLPEILQEFGYAQSGLI